MHDHARFDIAAVMRGEPSSIALLTAAKERIRWLSRKLVAAEAAMTTYQVPAGTQFVCLGADFSSDWGATTSSPAPRKLLTHC